MKVFHYLFASFFVASLLASTVNNAFAQESGAGMTVTPTVIERASDPGITIVEQLTLKNISNETKEFFLYTKDIVGVEDGGTPVFAEEGAEPTGYEMSTWIATEVASLTLAPEEERVLNVTITVPMTASPGSHFAGIFASVQPPRLREIGAGVGYEVASIISIRISGEAVDTARIRSFSTDKLFYGSKNVEFTARIENQGNILIRPRGPLTIESTFGGEVYSMLVNESLSGVFPGAVRDLVFSWNDDSLGFGRYEAILALSYEGNDGQKTIDATSVFWIFPGKVMLIVIAAFVSIFVVGYFATRFYIDRAVMRAAGGRRIPLQRYRKQVGVSRFTFVIVALLFVTLLFLIAMLIFFA